MPPTATRPEPTTAPEDTAAEKPAANAAASAGSGGLKAWLPLGITVLLMPVLAYAMTTFVLLPRLQKGLGVSASTSPGEVVPDKKGGNAAQKKESVGMSKLLVNVAGTMGSRYLLVSISIVGNDPDFKAKMQEFDPQLRDMACGALSTKTLADLEKPGARNLIRGELISGFNNILGSAMVQEIYLTEFAIQ